MILHTLWITRKGYETSIPEMVAAWDEFGVDENYDGWIADCKQALESVGNDLVEQRYIEIDVPIASIKEAFGINKAEGKVHQVHG